MYGSGNTLTIENDYPALKELRCEAGNSLVRRWRRALTLALLPVVLFLAGSCQEMIPEANAPVEQRSRARAPKANTPRPPPADRSSPMHGIVSKVIDGDSMEVLVDSRTVRVRLHAIDAPERAQPFSRRSSQELRSRLLRESVTLVPRNTDVHGRLVAVVRHRDEDIGLAQVRAGLAWHFRCYARQQPESDRLLYAAAERSARDSRAGLWADANPVSPWRYRGSRCSD